MNIPSKSDSSVEKPDQSQDWVRRQVFTYIRLSIQQSLSESDANNIAIILEAAQKNDLLNLLINEVDALIHRQQNLSIKLSCQELEHQRKLLIDIICSFKSAEISSVFLNKTHVNYQISIEEYEIRSMNLEKDFLWNREAQAIKHLLQKYYLLSSCHDLSKEQANQLERILKQAEQNIQLSLCINEVDEWIAQDFHLLSLDAKHHYMDQKARIKEFIEPNDVENITDIKNLWEILASNFLSQPLEELIKNQETASLTNESSQVDDDHEKITSTVSAPKTAQKELKKSCRTSKQIFTISQKFFPGRFSPMSLLSICCGLIVVLLVGEAFKQEFNSDLQGHSMRTFGQFIPKALLKDSMTRDFVLEQNEKSINNLYSALTQIQLIAESNQKSAEATQLTAEYYQKSAEIQQQLAEDNQLRSETTNRLTEAQQWLRRAQSMRDLAQQLKQQSKLSETRAREHQAEAVQLLSEIKKASPIEISYKQQPFFESQPRGSQGKEMVSSSSMLTNSYPISFSIGSITALIGFRTLLRRRHRNRATE